MKRLILLSLLFAIPALAETRYSAKTPVITAGTYAPKDSVGGVQAFTNITCSGTRRGRLVSVVLSDKSDNAVEYDILIFKENPSGTFNDKGAVDPLDGDLLNLNPVINLAATDHFSFNDNGVSSLSSLSSRALATTQGTVPGTLYVVIVSRGAPTYASTSDVTLTLGFDCDY